ncbi:MAG: hypothetical protein HGB08_02355 [Candidatus Moranbacteria bacterium]|nr:hypothetical protein [Candidatus Moranbacteria bacterium]
MSGFLKKVAANIAVKKKRIGEVGAAYMFDLILEHAFNYPLYGYVMWRFGLQKGFLIMVSLSFLICYAQIRVYDYLKKDLFLIEGVKDWVDGLKKYEGHNWFRRAVAFSLKKGGVPIAFVILSLWKDPFYTVAFCRNGRYNGLSVKGWSIFLSSLVVGNATWALAVFGGVESIKFIIG